MSKKDMQKAIEDAAVNLWWLQLKANFAWAFIIGSTIAVAVLAITLNFPSIVVLVLTIVYAVVISKFIFRKFFRRNDTE